MNNKTIILLSFFVLTTSCKTRYNITNQSSIFDLYSERELNILSSMEYIKYKQQGCEGSCKIRVSGVYEYFDNCLIQWDSIYFKSIGLDLNKKIQAFPRNYYLENFGTVFFLHPDESLDYYFSPLVFDKNKKSVIGQVRLKDGQKYSFGLNILGNDLFFSYEEPYRSDTCFE